MNARQEPTFEANIPDDLAGDGPMAARLAEAYFGKPYPWQPRLLDAMLARDASDRYAVSTLGISIPRQNGKSWAVRARCFYGAINGEKILYTCQHGDTSDEMFQELSRPFEDDDEPELHDLLKTVRKTNGQQAIRLSNGGVIRFTTRTDSLARGKTYDVLIYDEAQELTAAQQAASLPSISAGAKRNPQTIYLGTPPKPGGTGSVFRELRGAVRAGKSKMAWIEWGADEIGDPHDRERWYRYNPSLGLRISPEAVESEAEQMAPDVFARERLGWWPSAQAALEPALDASKWDAGATEEPMEAGKLGFGVRFSPDGRTVAVSWARAERGGRSYVELYDVAGADRGTAPIADMLLRNADEIAAVAIDGKAGADVLVRRLRDRGFPKRAIVQGTSGIAQEAASMLAEEVNCGTVSHYRSEALDESARRSVRRSIGGNGGWGFGDGPSGMAAPVESASLALYAARTAKRDPGIVQKASF